MSAVTVVAVDVGTHTILATAIRRGEQGPERLGDRQWFARLGEGLRASGRLKPEAIARGVRALGELRLWAAALGADEVTAVATRACREAANAQEFLGPAAAALGAPIRVVPGEEEAQLSFRGASSGLDLEGPATYVDVGGGSTEIIEADGRRLVGAISTSLGAVALTEKHLRSDPYAPAELAAVRGEVRGVLRSCGLPLRPTVVGIGGTATSLVALELGLAPYDPERVHGRRLPAAAFRARLATLAGLPAAERRRLRGLEPERAPVITAGALVLDEILAAAGATELVVSDRGIRHALLLDRLGPSR